MPYYCVHVFVGVEVWGSALAAVYVGVLFVTDRKSDFHQLKRLQREEMKETTVFYHRIKGEREAQEKKSELEQQEVERRFEVVSEAMSKKHRKEVEKLEQQQLQEFKSKAKTLKADQVRVMEHDAVLLHIHPHLESTIIVYMLYRQNSSKLIKSSKRMKRRCR